MLEEQYIEEKIARKTKSENDLVIDEATPFDSYTPVEINSIFDKNYLPMTLTSRERMSKIPREMQLRRIGAVLLIPLVFEILGVIFVVQVNPICYVMIAVTAILAIILFAASSKSDLPPE